MNKKILISGTGAILAIMAMAGFYNHKNIPGNATPVGNSIKVGLVLGQTGAASTWAEYAKKAADLATKEINDAGGVNGKPLELIYEDSKTTAAGSVSAFQKLTDIDNVDVVVGDLWSFITNPLVPVSEKKKILLISPTVMDGAVESNSPYFYTVGHTVESQETAVATFIKKYPDAKTAAILCWNDAWGKSHSNLFRKVSEAKGISVVGEVCTRDFTSDYRSEVTKIKGMNPDLVFLTTSLPASSLKAMNDLRLNVPVLTTNAMVDGLEVQKMPREYGLDKYFMDWQPDDEFMRKFKKAYGTTPIMEAQNSYEAVRTIAKALEKNQDNILAGIKQVSYRSVDGDMDFTTGDQTTVNKALAKLFRVTEAGYEEIR